MGRKTTARQLGHLARMPEEMDCARVFVSEETGTGGHHDTGDLGQLKIYSPDYSPERRGALVDDFAVVAVGNDAEMRERTECLLNPGKGQFLCSKAKILPVAAIAARKPEVRVYKAICEPWIMRSRFSLYKLRPTSAAGSRYVRSASVIDALSRRPRSASKTVPGSQLCRKAPNPLVVDLVARFPGWD
jgi:hypothetical protein